MVPLSEKLVQVQALTRDKAIYLTCCRWVRDGRYGRQLDTAVRHVCRTRRASAANRWSRGVLIDYFIPPADPPACYALKWDGEWRVTMKPSGDCGRCLVRWGWC